MTASSPRVQWLPYYYFLDSTHGKEEEEKLPSIIQGCLNQPIAKLPPKGTKHRIRYLNNPKLYYLRDELLQHVSEEYNYQSEFLKKRQIVKDKEIDNSEFDFDIDLENQVEEEELDLSPAGDVDKKMHPNLRGSQFRGSFGAAAQHRFSNLQQQAQKIMANEKSRGSASAGGRASDLRPEYNNLISISNRKAQSGYDELPTQITQSNSLRPSACKMDDKELDWSPSKSIQRSSSPAQFDTPLVGKNRTATKMTEGDGIRTHLRKMASQEDLVNDFPPPAPPPRSIRKTDTFQRKIMTEVTPENVSSLRKKKFSTRSSS